jgi:mono/diheme cytochrome c family protein
MTLIVSILGFMMDPGSWHTKRTLFSGMLNPLYLPQLAFRTPLAMVLAGALGLPAVARLAPPERRAEAVRAVCRWLLVWAPLCLLGAWWYARSVPVEMAKNLPVALLTQGLAAWSRRALEVAAIAVGAILVVALWGAFSRRRLWLAVGLAPAVLCVWLVGHFERVREFIRKPYAINGYLFANGVRKDDYPILRRDGILAHTAYEVALPPSGDDRRDLGAEVFLAACSRCHTTDGINGMRGLLAAMYGERAPWDETAIAAYVQGLHNVRPYMPAFPGSDDERHALARFLASLRTDPTPLPGAQTAGIRPSHHAPRAAATLSALP